MPHDPPRRGSYRDVLSEASRRSGLGYSAGAHFAVQPTPLCSQLRVRDVLRTSPRAQALEGKHPVCFRSEPGHVRGRSPPAVERSQALLVLGGPTGHSAPLSDVDGNLVLFELAEQFSGGRYAHALQALDVLFDHQLGSIPGEDHRYLLPDIEGAVGRYVQRHGGQGRVFHPLGDYVEQPHLVLLLSDPFRSSEATTFANLSTMIMMPSSEVWCTDVGLFARVWKKG